MTVHRLLPPPVCGLLAASVLASVASAADSPALAPTEPKQPRNYQIPDGFTATVYGEPPDIRYPVCLTAMPDGSLFVGIDENGSLDREPNRSSVILCRDLNQDGRGDVFKAFVENVDSPRGLVWDGEWLYVLHPPDLSAWRDTDGDGVADEKRVLVKGIGFDLGFRGADHTSNGIQMGIDGWIYAAIGDYGFKHAEGADGRVLVLRGGGIVRVRPDGSGLDLVSRGQRNIYDVAVSPLLERFTRDNTNDGGGWDVRLSHIVDLADYGYPSLFKNFNEEIMPPLADYGGGSPCGSLWIQEPTLPAPWKNMLYTVEWGRSKVYAHPLQDKGAGYEAGQEEFISINRPTDMDVDASGRIYVSSWQGGEFNFKGPDVGWMLEVRPANWQPVTLPDLKKADVATLLVELANAGAVRRFHAQRELLRRHLAEEQEAALVALAGDSNRSLEVRATALFTASQAGLPARALQALAADQALRRFVVRALGDGSVRDADEIPTDWFVAALKDADPKVRREALIAIARLHRTDAAAAVFALQQSGDRVLSHTARKAFVMLEQPEPALAALASSDAGGYEAAQMALRELHREDVIDGVVKALSDNPDPSRRLPLLTTLVRLYFQEDTWRSQWWGTRPDTTGPYYDRGTWDQTPRIEGVLTNELERAAPELRSALIQQLVRHRVEFKDLLPYLVGRAIEDPSLRQSAVEALARQQTVPNFAGFFLETVLADDTVDPGTRAKAMDALGKSLDRRRGASRAYGHLARWPLDVPDELRDARRRFVTSGDRFADIDSYLLLAEKGATGDRVLSYAVLASMARRDKDKARAAKARAAVEAATSSSTAFPQLLQGIGTAGMREYADLIEHATVSEAEAVRTAATWASAQAGLRDRRRAPRQGRSISEMSLEDVVTAVKRINGNAERGKTLFEQQACHTCHTVDPKEPVKGPYLGDIAKRYSREELAMSILRPSATIAQGFESQLFVMKDEREIQGFVVSESGDAVSIRDATGNEQQLAKGEIDKRERRDISIMPEGLVDPLSARDLASLIAYLQQLANPQP